MKLNTERPSRRALINGNIVYYDVCSKTLNSYESTKFHYIGEGVIYSINGYAQKSTIRYHFYTKL
jgi:hypothetical protein